MTNLLSHHVQKQIASEYKRRRTVVILGTCMVTVFLSAGFLLPSYLLSTIRLDEVARAATQARATVDELQKTKSAASLLLTKAESQLKALDVKDSQLPSEVVRMVTDIKGPYVRIQSVTFEAGNGETKGKLAVVGIARDRDSLTGFVKQLQENALFSLVDLPVSNFAKDKDINFSINIEGTF